MVFEAGEALQRDDARALQFVERFGRTATAFQALNPGLHHWFDAARGLVAFVDTGRAWVAAGEPICAPQDAIDVALAFVAAAHRARRRACFFATEGILASSPRFRRIRLGEQPVWDPRRWDAHVREHRSFREQLRRARAKGVVVRRTNAHDLESQPRLMNAAAQLVDRWLSARPMPAMRFLVEVAPLHQPASRRIFVAERAGAMIGLLSLAPVPAREGWLFEHTLRDPHAPNGTAELLVDAAMRVLAHDGAPWATLGLAPLAGPVTRWLRVIKVLARPLFNFEGLAAFKRKLRPQTWEPIFLAFPARDNGLRALLDGLRAFAGTPLWRFGLRTIARGPRSLLLALEWMLIPWTILLAFVPTARWFPSAWIHGGWVAFDIALYFTLRMSRHHGWRVGLPPVATAVTLDALLTMAQALVWNAPRIATWQETCWVLVACAAPVGAAWVLWGAVRRLRPLHPNSGPTL